MTMQTESPAPAPSAQVVGNAFVEQYYHILHQSPDLVYRFYQDSSFLSRPEPNGVMSSVTTMRAINDKILSLDYKDYKAEIRTVDAQESHKEGVIVLVTGWLTGKDNIRKKFTQSFFLAPQDKGYFVLNDVFRYVEEYESPETDHVSANGINDSTSTALLTPDPEPGRIPIDTVPDLVTPLAHEDLNDVEVVYDQSENDEGEVVDEVVITEVSLPSTENEVHSMVDPVSPTLQEDAPKKSYASIVKVMKGSTTTSVYVPTKTVRAAPINSQQQSSGSSSPSPAPESSGPSSNDAPESGNAEEEVEGHSIYIKGLPLNATVSQLEEEFKKFGPIKLGGIQVRSNKQGFCFGFVEFELLSSMHSAIEASPVMIGGRQAFIEEKRTTSRVGSGRGRFPPGRVGYRNDNFRGRGNFGGNRGYGRNDFGNRGDFSGRGRGSSGRGAEGYQRVDQNGSGRVGRQGGISQTAISA